MSRRTVMNAFTRGQYNPRQRLAASLAAMRASLVPAPFGFVLELSPMFAADAAAALFATDAGLDGASEHRVLNLVACAESIRSDEALPLPVLARRLDLVGADRAGDEYLIVDDEQLRQLLSLVPVHRLDIVRVMGPIEPRDARAILDALDRGDSPLDFELRAVAALRVTGDHSLTLHTRDRRQAFALVAENFRHFLAAMCDFPASEFAGPALEQLRPLFDEGGITVRPLETEVFSMFVDIGVCLTPDEPVQPAERSLIYDRPSDTWHTE